MRSRTGFRTVATLKVAAVMLVGLVGCGEESTAADQFVGTWRYGDVMSTVQRFDADPQSLPVAPHKTFVHGVGAEIVDLSQSPLMRDTLCDFVFDVAGPVAQIRPEQTCFLNSVDTLTIDLGPDGKPLWTFKLTSATTAEELATGTMHIYHPDTSQGPATEETASWSLVAHLTRISKD